MLEPTPAVAPAAAVLAWDTPPGSPPVDDVLVFVGFVCDALADADADWSVPAAWLTVELGWPDVVSAGDEVPALDPEPLQIAAVWVGCEGS